MSCFDEFQCNDNNLEYFCIYASFYIVILIQHSSQTNQKLISLVKMMLLKVSTKHTHTKKRDFDCSIIVLSLFNSLLGDIKENVALQQRMEITSSFSPLSILLLRTSETKRKTLIYACVCIQFIQYTMVHFWNVWKGLAIKRILSHSFQVNCK